MALPGQILYVWDFNRELEHEFAWPGGYQRYFITNDGAVLSFEAARENASIIRQSIIEDASDGWRICAVDINWEDPELYCDHTNRRIPSAYGE